jgi:hypothetical protein
VDVWVYEPETVLDLIKIWAKIKCNVPNCPVLKLLYFVGRKHYEPLFERYISNEERLNSSNILNDSFSQTETNSSCVINNPSSEHSYSRTSNSSLDNNSQNEHLSGQTSNTFVKTRIGCANYREGNIEENNLGSMDGLCSYCGALFFQSEVVQKDNTFHKCCMSGKYLFRFFICENCEALDFENDSINTHGFCHTCFDPVTMTDDSENENASSHFRDIIPAYDRITDLMTNKYGSQSINFRQNIRSFNSALAFASFGASMEAGCVPGRGPYCFRVQGLIYHLRSNLGNAQRDKKYAQLYFIDSNLANDERIKNNPNCD